MLHQFLAEERDELIERCKAKVIGRRSPRATDADLDYGVPLFLDQLIDTLRRELRTSTEIGETATKHGNELLRRGFTVDQVVQDYGDFCQAVTELAVEVNAPITSFEFHTLNRCLDEAIAGAVTEYGRQHDQIVSEEYTVRLGVLTHELRNLIHAAGLAFDALSSGSVGVNGSTGAVLKRCLRAMGSLVDRSLAEVRLDAGILNKEPIRVAELVEEVRVSAVLAANAHGIQFVVPGVEDGLVVEADRLTLTSVLANLLVNAFKFSRPGGTVTLSTRAVADRVLFEVADECGGLPAGEARELFQPFEQRGADRTGIGLGLTICLRGAEANGGTLHVRDIPGTGCVFTVDLPNAECA
jgi:signal transduction histidine kinase